MTETQLELTRLIGRKDLTFGCLVKPKNPELFRFKSENDFARIYKHEEEGYTWMAWNDGDLGKEDSEEFLRDFEIIGHPATLTDFHRWMNDNMRSWEHMTKFIRYGFSSNEHIKYNSSKPLLDQSEGALQEIINLIKKYGERS